SIHRARGQGSFIGSSIKKSTGRQVKAEKYLAANHGTAKDEGNYVRVLTPGNTIFSIYDTISPEAFKKENDRVKKLGLNPATGEVLKGGKYKRLPQTLGSSPDELVREVKELWKEACEWEGIPPKMFQKIYYNN
ncbi:hypothetical protein LCGC14_2421280, partial [marine sediment metagenome]